MISIHISLVKGVRYRSPARPHLRRVGSALGFSCTQHKSVRFDDRATSQRYLYPSSAVNFFPNRKSYICSKTSYQQLETKRLSSQSASRTQKMTVEDNILNTISIFAQQLPYEDNMSYLCLLTPSSKRHSRFASRVPRAARDLQCLGVLVTRVCCKAILSRPE